ncbi:MAG TPA: type 1 glutamine amidotransferase domain-containing protein [Steroidobacteraceae bacterium]|nr:type 1 glutamine amidotransferase domain-containing protein [Steroidobacteraceae bacterium]
MKTKRVLAVLSEYGYWGVELTGPQKELERVGYGLDYVTPNGRRPHALPPSYDPTYVDPPLNYNVTPPEIAEQVKAFDSGPALDHPLSLATLFPERPYFSAPNFLRAWESYHSQALEAQRKTVSDYDAVLLVGGSGPIVDMVNNQRVHDLVLGFYKTNKPVAAICYGVACLVFARDFNERESIIRGNHVTGHCIEYDYHDGTGFFGTDFNMGPPPYVLEYMLSDAVGPEGRFHGNFGKPTSVIVDYPFITARSLQCAEEFGEQFVNMLDNGLRRYGW